jgi:hypothetical protein
MRHEGGPGPIFPVQRRPRRESASITAGRLIAWLVPVAIVVVAIVVIVSIVKSPHLSGPATQTLFEKEVTLAPGQSESGSFTTETYCLARLTVTPTDGVLSMVLDRIEGAQPTEAERKSLVKKLATMPGGEPYKIAMQGGAGKHFAWLVINQGDKPVRGRIELRLHRD